MCSLVRTCVIFITEVITLYITSIFNSVCCAAIKNFLSLSGGRVGLSSSSAISIFSKAVNKTKQKQEGRSLYLGVDRQTGDVGSEHVDSWYSFVFPLPPFQILSEVTSGWLIHTHPPPNPSTPSSQPHVLSPLAPHHTPPQRQAPYPLAPQRTPPLPQGRDWL